MTRGTQSDTNTSQLKRAEPKRRMREETHDQGQHYPHEYQNHSKDRYCEVDILSVGSISGL
jgi:hypothetical protein